MNYKCRPVLMIGQAMCKMLLTGEDCNRMQRYYFILICDYLFLFEDLTT